MDEQKIVKRTERKKEIEQSKMVKDRLVKILMKIEHGEKTLKNICLTPCNFNSSEKRGIYDGNYINIRF